MNLSGIISPLQQLYLKIFLISGVTYAALNIISADDLTSGSTILSLVIKGVVFGAFMALFMGTWHISMLRDEGVKTLDAESLSLRQTREIPTHLTEEELISTIKRDPQFGKLKLAKQGDVIAMHTGISFFSWGTKITLRLRKEHDGLQTLEIFSRPRFALTLFDYGKNYRNVTKLQNLVKQHMSTGSQA